MTLDINTLPGFNLITPKYRKAVLFAVFGAAGCFLASLFGEAWLALSLRTAPGGAPTCGTVVLLIDTSGSMNESVGNGSRLDAVRAAGKRFVRDLIAKNINVGVTSFNNAAMEVQAPTRSLPLLETALDSLAASGGTAMDAGLSETAENLSKVNGSRAVVLFTDGEPDNMFFAAKAAETLRQMNIVLIAVGTEDARQDTLYELTKDVNRVKTTSSNGIDLAFQGVQKELGALIGTTRGDSGFMSMLFSVSLWTGLIAVGLTLCLIVGQNLYLGKEVLNPLQLRWGIGGGLASGIAAGGIALILYHITGIENRIVDTLLNILGWAILGVLLALGISKIVPNLRPNRAAIGGAIGGVAGGIVFNLLSLYSYSLARMGGAPILGACIGLMIAYVDLVMSRAWLEVIWGPRDVRLINLGPKPVRVGSNRELCDVIIRQAPAEVYRYKFEQGRVMIEDVATSQTTPIASGEERHVGAIILRVNAAISDGNSPITAATAPAQAQSVSHVAAVVPAVLAPPQIRPATALQPHPPALKPFSQPVSVDPKPLPVSVPSSVAPAVVATPMSFSATVRPAPQFVQTSASDRPAQICIQLPDGGIVTIEQGRPLLGALLGSSFASTNIAEVVQSPTDPKILGLRNICGMEWIVRRTSGDSSRVASGKTMRAETNSQLQIGNMIIRIV